MNAQRRSTPLVLVAGPDNTAADVTVQHWRGEGAVVVRARDWRGCLRMATAIGPDVIALDRRIPSHLVARIRSHPVSRTANIEWLAHPLYGMAPPSELTRLSAEDG